MSSGCSSSVECSVRDRVAPGSIPGTPTNIASESLKYARMIAMIYSQLLLGIIGFGVAYFLLLLLNNLIFHKKSKDYNKHMQAVSLISAFVYTAWYWRFLFITEGEARGTGLGQGFFGFLIVLPLFLYFFMIFLLILAALITILITACITIRHKL